MKRTRTVGEVAGMAGVTVRAMHHYHEIGLVVPGGRSANGYRTYGHAEIERLQEVLFFRELGFPLDEIKQILTRPSYSRLEALQRQRDLLEERVEHLLELVAAVDRAADAARQGLMMSEEEMLEVFGDFDPAAYEAEARHRWGDTDAYQHAAARTAGYTKEDWQRHQQESAAITRRFLSLMEAGVPAEDPAAMDLAEEHRAHVNQWFYDCPKPMHAGLGRMYVTDARFKENIDKAGAGLAEYMAAAIVANAGR